MILNITSPPGTVNKVINNVMVSSEPNGNTVGKKNVTNFAARSFNYQNMNQLVITLDENFKFLPMGPGPGTQHAWNTASTGFSSIPVCGCDEMIATGQKLYRSYNFFRSILGLTASTTPPTPLPGTAPVLIAIEYGPGPGPPYTYLYGSVAGWIPPGAPVPVYLPCWTIVNFGKGIQNCIFPADASTFAPGSPQWDQTSAWILKAPLVPLGATSGWRATCCTFGLDGTPYGSYETLILKP